MKHLLSAIAVALFVAGGAISSAKAMDQKPHSAKSIECSKRADAKGLHGKARHKFRSECRRGKI
jgi:hypothetical protein